MTYQYGVIEAELRGEEKLLWYGRPRQGILLRAGDALLIPFSLLWCGFIFFWEYSVITSGAPPFFVLWGIPFVLVGLYFVVGRFFSDKRRRERTCYALTSKRVLIIFGILSKNVKSLSLTSLTEITLSEGKNGEGSIVFGPQNSMPFMAGWPGSARLQSPQFELISSAREVYELIQRAKSGAPIGELEVERSEEITS